MSHIVTVNTENLADEQLEILKCGISCKTRGGLSPYEVTDEVIADHLEQILEGLFGWYQKKTHDEGFAPLTLLPKPEVLKEPVVEEVKAVSVKKREPVAIEEIVEEPVEE